MKRGLKAEIARICKDVRGDLGLSPNDRLDPYELAGHWGIEVESMASLGCSSNALSWFGGTGESQFSAITVVVGYQRLIVVNEHHTQERLANSVCHEMSHVILEHDPTDMVDLVGGRHWNGEHEDAANEMAGQLLIPPATAKGLAYRGVAVDEVARRFRVSPELARWRLNVSGGYQMRRAAGGQSV